MILSLGDRIGAGAFADVFRLSESAVLKLLRRMQVIEDPIEDPMDHETVIRAVWDAECTAHEIVASRPGLGRHLVPFFGRVAVSDVVDARGQSRGSDYVLDCGMQLAWLSGSEEKVGNLQAHPLFSRIDAYLDELNESGINAPWDSSVFIPGLESDFTVIDVGTWEALAELSAVLADVGRLPESARSKWAKPFV